MRTPDTKRLLLSLLFLSFALGLSAQQLKVLDFHTDPANLSAKMYQKTDYNNDPCGLVKIGLVYPNATFEGNVFSSEYKGGEWWVYMTNGSQRLTIKTGQHVPLDYKFDEPILSNVTYKMTIISVGEGPKPLTQQYLAFQVTPANATLEVNGEIWELDADGTAMKFVNFGTYTYSVHAKDYHVEEGSVTVDNPNDMQKKTIALRPNFGWIEVAGTGVLQGASVYIDNDYVGKAPWRSERLKSGQHTVRIAKEMYEGLIQTVTVADNETTRIAPTLTADFARVTLTVDADAEIWVNNERKGTRSWTGPLGSGTYKIECKQANHETSVTTKEIAAAMNGQTITLPTPKPIYGSLNVESSPNFCKLFVDGKPMGETPKFVPEILIGRHEIKLTKDGYADHTETVTIAKGERKQVTATLSRQETAPRTAAPVTNDNTEDITFTVKGVSFTMKRVEGGTFQMGAQSKKKREENYDSDAFSNEIPVHSVTLSSYYMGETEVTQALWKAVMGSEPTYSGGWESQYGRGDNYPAYGVSWNDCQEFIRKLSQITGRSFRLPTEAEWEYAARGGKNSNGYKYAGNDTIGSVAWYYGNSGIGTHDVKGKQANELGLYDMSGNVGEWCSDRYGSYNNGSQTNPTGASSGSHRVLRGGSWNYIAMYCRVSNRTDYFPDDHFKSIGFRLALVP